MSHTIKSSNKEEKIKERIKMIYSLPNGGLKSKCRIITSYFQQLFQFEYGTYQKHYY